VWYSGAISVAQAVVHVNGVRPCLWNVGTSGPIVHPSDGMLAWRTIVEWYWWENWRTQRKTCLSATLSTTNPTWTDPGLCEHRQLATSLLLWKPGFAPRQSPCGILVDKVVRRQVSLQVLLFSPISIIPPLPHIHWGWTIGLLAATEPFSPHCNNKNKWCSVHSVLSTTAQNNVSPLYAQCEHCACIWSE
jgi:hypothetical protein